MVPACGVTSPATSPANAGWMGSSTRNQSRNSSVLNFAFGEVIAELEEAEMTKAVYGTVRGTTEELTDDEAIERVLARKKGLQ